jgi:glycosyltransferase involved in cell wall biosynthesis
VPLRVLYFGISQLGTQANGGSIGARNHVRRLAEEPDIELTVATAAQRDTSSGAHAFLSELPVIPHVLEMVTEPATGTDRPRRAPLLYEEFVPTNLHLDRALADIAEAASPQVVIIDYLYSALFCPTTLANAVPKVLIARNPELPFYREMIRDRVVAFRRRTSWRAYVRLALFERAVVQRCAAVYTTGPNDISRKARVRTRWIEPYLDPAEDRWSFAADEPKLLFLGNPGHFPNRRAIEWIATRFAPELQHRAPEARISIIGAVAEDMPESWRHHAVEFLGVADRPTVVHELRTSRLMLAPIDNAFGTKWKVLEAMAHGTPMLATSGALSGLSRTAISPTIDLRDPADAAERAASLVNDRAALEHMSAEQRTHLAHLAERRAGFWGKALREDLGIPAGV